MLKTAIIGFGFMGKMHLGCWMRLPEVQVTALCDANMEQLRQFKGDVGNIAGLPKNLNLSDFNPYTSAREMLRQEKPDVVSITLPTHLHCDLVIEALQSGAHVLCEKPMALTVADCRKMIDAASATGKKLMIGHCIRFWPDYVWLKKAVDSGDYGRLLAARFERMSVRPGWSSGNWLADSAKSGGMLLDLHIHDADFIQYLLGTPRGVSCRCNGSTATADHAETIYHYDNGPMISASGSWLATASLGFRMNYEAILEKAIVRYDCTSQSALRVFPAEGQPFCPALEPGDGYGHEIEWFSRWITGQPVAPVITPEQSMESVRIIDAEKQAADSGQTVYL